MNRRQAEQGEGPLPPEVSVALAKWELLEALQEARARTDGNGRVVF